jgi:hypothetical protein
MKVTVGVSHTINIGNYESVKPSIYVEDEVGSNEDFGSTHARVSRVAHDLWVQEAVRHIEEAQKMRQTGGSLKGEPSLRDLSRQIAQLSSLDRVLNPPELTEGGPCEETEEGDAGPSFEGLIKR